jgi:tetratricopeptide (TPR) repeat protein
MSICTLCKLEIFNGSPEKWTTCDGQSVQIVLSAAPSASVDTSFGDFEICESCYHHGLPSFFTSQDLAGIHYQFGLEYHHRGLPAQSMESHSRALGLMETANIAAGLALAESELGHRELAIAHYRRALEIDPSHFMSQQNLQKLYGTVA